MLQPNSLTSLRNSSSSMSNYFLKNLIQPNLAVIGTKNSYSAKPNLPMPNENYKTRKETAMKSKQIQKLAEEVANLLIDEQRLITEEEKG